MTKVISKKEFFKAKLFTVYEDNLILDSGSKRKYYSVIRKPAVSIFPLDDQLNLYLTDQYRYMHEKRIIEAPAGMIEEGEKPIETAKRELKEELGIVARKWRQIGTTVAAGSIAIWDQPLFLAQDLHFIEQHLEESEDIKVLKLSLSNAVEKVLKGEISTGSSVMGIMIINELSKSGRL